MKKKRPADQSIFLLGIIKHNVCAIVEHEDEVLIEVVDDFEFNMNNHLSVNVFVHHDDVGLVIGESGATADAIRRIVWVACKKTDLRIDVMFGARLLVRRLASPAATP